MMGKGDNTEYKIPNVRAGYVVGTVIAMFAVAVIMMFAVATTALIILSSKK